MKNRIFSFLLTLILILTVIPMAVSAANDEAKIGSVLYATLGDAITAAKDGTSFEWVATAENGWHAVVVNGRVGWVSGKYAKLA